MIVEIAVLGGLGFAFGFLLSYASEKLEVKKNPLVERIRAVLPGANCGACGLAGCDAFAEAVAGGNAAVDGCIPGQKAVADKVSDILRGKPVEENMAKGDKEGDKIGNKSPVQDGKDSKPAQKIILKPIKVDHGLCIGCTLCAKKCPKQAINMVEKKAVIIQEKCIRCGICINACPKKAIFREE